ncbi:MAG: 50S ribosomal protein L9 [Candidatus Hydrogenedentes bacterium]|nr:50S ribosomal protein L9 [Candidatus Hydrogenedentota bacterium]
MLDRWKDHSRDNHRKSCANADRNRRAAVQRCRDHQAGNPKDYERISGKREQKRRAELVQVAGTLEGVTLEFTAKAGAEGKLFGSITNLHISNKLAELGHQVNRRKIQLAEPLKSLGEHAVSIQLTSGVGATIKVIVEAEEPESGKAEKKVATTEAAPEGAESSAAEEPSTEEALSEVIVNTGDGDESAGEPATS